MDILKAATLVANSRHKERENVFFIAYRQTILILNFKIVSKKAKVDCYSTYMILYSVLLSQIA